MERIIEVSIFTLSLTQRSTRFISSYIEFDIKCDILFRDVTVFWDKYILKLNGDEKDIQRYIDHLLNLGFKIRMARYN